MRAVAVDVIVVGHTVASSGVLITAVKAASASSTIAPASARISSSVRSWIGWGDEHRWSAGWPSLRACSSAAWTKASEATSTAGLPAPSNSTHVAQTARHAGASVGERLDHRVAALRRSRCARRPAPAW